MASPSKQICLERKNRNKKIIPVKVVENHCDALPHIYRFIGRKVLPFNDCIMIHMDSHPDLGIPFGFKADCIQDKDKLFECLEIENWIIPAMYAGHVTCMVWVKGPWCKQITDGEYEFYVGAEKSSGEIRLTWCDEYFASDGCCVSSAAALQDPRLVTVHVLTARLCPACSQLLVPPPTDKPTEVCPTCVECNRAVGETIRRVVDVRQHRRTAGGQPTGDFDDAGALGSCPSSSRGSAGESEGPGRTGYILDIDLDYISTLDPFRAMLHPDAYRLLEGLYAMDFDPMDVDTYMVKRKAQLDRNKELLRRAAADGDGESSTCTPTVNDDAFATCKKIMDTVGDGVSWETVHQAGLTCDPRCGGLPQDVASSSEQLNVRVRSLVHAVLSHVVSARPALVTVARSSWDEYCPAAQVDHIQAEVVRVIRELYGSENVQVEEDYHHYY